MVDWILAAALIASVAWLKFVMYRRDRELARLVDEVADQTKLSLERADAALTCAGTALEASNTALHGVELIVLHRSNANHEGGNNG